MTKLQGLNYFNSINLDNIIKFNPVKTSSDKKTVILKPLKKLEELHLSTKKSNSNISMLPPSQLIQLFGNDNNNVQIGIPEKLKIAGEAAYQKHKKVSGSCEATANTLHRMLTGNKKSSVRYLPKANLGENGKPLSYLKTLIDEGKLKPGMVIFINTLPSMKMPNLSPSDRHWFTYMGIDAKTKQPVFNDQYGTNRSLERMLRLRWVKNPDVKGHNERKLHTIFDPYGDKRDELLGKPKV